jgi:hypothetical protein
VLREVGGSPAALQATLEAAGPHQFKCGASSDGHGGTNVIDPQLRSMAQQQPTLTTADA